MFDNFANGLGNALQQVNNNMNSSASGQNSMGLAGLLIAGGMMPDQAYVQAAQIHRNKEINDLARQKQEQQQQAMLQASQILSSGGSLADLLNSGVEPRTAAALFEANRPNPLANTFAGASGVRYEGVRNPQTGEVEARPLSGQILKEQPKLSTAEIRINATKLKELANDARTAEKELRLLEDAEAAFNELDAAQGQGSLTGSGSIYSKVAPNFADNIALTQKGQSAKQKIDKINSQLYQNRVQGAGARATDSFKEEVKKGLPSYQLQPEARQGVLETKARENLEMLARSRFFSEWVKRNNKDLNGAEDAFNAYISNAKLLNEDGRINRELLKEIPKVVAEFLQDPEATTGANVAPEADMTEMLLEERSLPQGSSSQDGLTDDELIRIYLGE